MKSIIQAVTISGEIIEEARWEMNLVMDLNDKNEIFLNFDTQDLKLMNALKRNNIKGVAIDGEKVIGYTISIKCELHKIKYMMNVSDNTTESMIIVTPENRMSEQVLFYLVNKKLCSPNFLKRLNH